MTEDQRETADEMAEALGQVHPNFEPLFSIAQRLIHKLEQSKKETNDGTS